MKNAPGGSIFVSLSLITNTFPQPLDEEEETYYLTRFHEGVTEARDYLIEHNLRLVAHIAKKYEGTGEESEDLISIGTIGLVKAINTFDPSKGVRLATYAVRCIENDHSKTMPCGNSY